MRRFLSIAAVGLLVACGASGTVAPRSLLPATNYACSNNPIQPAGAFRMLYRHDGRSSDTSSIFANAYLQPHRSADTVRTVTNQGGVLLIVFGSGGDSSTYCVTLYDSLAHHLPNVFGAILVP